MTRRACVVWGIAVVVFSVGVSTYGQQGARGNRKGGGAGGPGGAGGFGGGGRAGAARAAGIAGAGGGMAFGQGQGGNVWMMIFDLNRDNAISADEIDQVAQMLKQMDRNGDLQLTADELPAPNLGGPQGPGANGANGLPGAGGGGGGGAGGGGGGAGGPPGGRPAGPAAAGPARKR